MHLVLGTHQTIIQREPFLQFLLRSAYCPRFLFHTTCQPRRSFHTLRPPRLFDPEQHYVRVSNAPTNVGRHMPDSTPKPNIQEIIHRHRLRWWHGKHLYHVSGSRNPASRSNAPIVANGCHLIVSRNTPSGSTYGNTSRSSKSGSHCCPDFPLCMVLDLWVAHQEIDEDDKCTTGRSPCVTRAPSLWNDKTKPLDGDVSFEE